MRTKLNIFSEITSGITEEDESAVYDAPGAAPRRRDAPKRICLDRREVREPFLSLELTDYMILQKSRVSPGNFSPGELFFRDITGGFHKGKGKAPRTPMEIWI